MKKEKQVVEQPEEEGKIITNKVKAMLIWGIGLILFAIFTFFVVTPLIGWSMGIVNG